MTTAIPSPRPAADDHLCDDDRPCGGCAGGTALPAAYTVELRSSGELRARCTDCGGAGWRCTAASS